MGEIIRIPVTRLEEGKRFHNADVSEALAACQRAGYRALFMPELIDARIALPKDSAVWQSWWTTSSLIATGRGRRGTPVVIYAHIDNYFSNPENIRAAINQGLIDGAGIMPEEEFYRLLDKEDSQNVYVVDYASLENAGSDAFRIKNAIRHPQTIPFLGGEERAEQCLKQYRKFYSNWIEILYFDKLGEKPVGRLLSLEYYGALGGEAFYSPGRFLGVRSEVALSDAQKTAASTLDNLIQNDLSNLKEA